jgi:hypothetical protein
VSLHLFHPQPPSGHTSDKRSAPLVFRSILLPPWWEFHLSPKSGLSSSRVFRQRDFNVPPIATWDSPFRGDHDRTFVHLLVNRIDIDTLRHHHNIVMNVLVPSMIPIARFRIWGFLVSQLSRSINMAKQSHQL